MTSGPVVYVLDSYVELSQTFVREEVRELRRRGVDVRVVALAHGDVTPDPDEPVTRLTEAYRGRLRLGLAWARWTLRHPVRVARAAGARWAVRGEPVPWGQLAALAADLDRAGARWVHAHFGWLGAATGIVLAALLDRPASMTLHARDIFVDVRHLDAKLARVARVVTVCRYNLDWLQAHHAPLPPTTLAVCGVRVPDEVPARGADGPDVVVVGRLVAKKGIDVLLDAVPRVLADVPDLQVAVVGDGPLREPLEQQAAALGVTDHVTFLGARPHDEVLRRVGDARLLCFPARIAPDGDRDSMPVVVKEAMARAVPVVASDLVAIPEMVDDACGVLVPPEDPEALADALVAVLADPDRARAMGRAGRARVQAALTLDHQVDPLEAMFAGGAGS